MGGGGWRCGAAPDVLRDPFQAVCEALAGQRAGGLDVPVMAADGRQGEGLAELCRRHRILQILLVRQHQDCRTLQMIVPEE